MQNLYKVNLNRTTKYDEERRGIEGATSSLVMTKIARRAGTSTNTTPKHFAPSHSQQRVSKPRQELVTGSLFEERSSRSSFDCCFDELLVQILFVHLSAG